MLFWISGCLIGLVLGAVVMYCIYPYMRSGRLIFCVRPICFLFVRSWYSTCRWEGVEYENEILHMLDIGMITIGYATTIARN